MAETTTGRKRFEKLRSVLTMKRLLLLAVVVAAVCLLPLPMLRIQTMTGECLRHGETVEVRMTCVELNYLFKDDVLYGLPYRTFRIAVDGGEEKQFGLTGGDGRKLGDYAVLLEDGTVQKDGQFEEFTIYQQLTTDHNRYNVITNRFLNRWVMVQFGFFSDDPGWEDCHLFVLAKDGDTGRVQEEFQVVIDEFRRWDEAKGFTGNA